MLKLYGQTDKVFNTNGDLAITPLKATVHKEDNGSYYLDLVVSLAYIDYMTEGRIIVANTPQGEQAFRITNPQKTRSKITIRAQHVFYDSENYIIRDSYVVNKGCNDALDHLNNATDQTSPFATLSDVTTVSSFRCVRKSLQEAISVVLERWGGHLVRDNWSIAIRASIGQDNGVVVQYKKNLKEITCTENWSVVCTKLMPVGKDGILLNELDSEADLYVYSETQYSIPYTKVISFSQGEVLEENYDSEEEYIQALVVDLKQQAINYVDIHCFPEVNYTLKANLEKITDIGDVVRVFDDRLNVDLITNVIAFDYDCILEKYINIEFGNFTKTLSGLMDTITNQTNEAITEESANIQITLGKELEQATSQIWNALGNSFVIYDGDKILVVDKLPKEDARNVIMINNGGIGFSQTGINGTFSSAWTIDGTLNMQSINVINLTANLIKGGTLKLGSKENESGILELYDDVNNLIGEMTKQGIKMYGTDGSYVLINNEVGFAGFDRSGTKIYWVSGDEFHMKKSVTEEEITLCNKVRFIPITLTDDNKNIISDGIGLVSTSTGT